MLTPPSRLSSTAGHRVVSVRNVAMWPDLEAGVAELLRVVRPKDTVAIA